MNGTFRVGNLFGIPFFVNASWFLVLGLVTWQYGGALAGLFPTLGPVAPWLLGLFAALLLFASVLAHELGHSWVAIKQGIGVKSISLFLFGGLANLERESKTPAEAFWVAIAGPLVSLFLAGLLTVIGVGAALTGPAAAIVQLLASINLALALFNLIPGLPLDGGNILKAIVWKITGNPYKGIIFASRVGQIIGWIAIATGIFGNIWNLVIGWFLLQNAGQSAQYATVQNELAGLTAADALTAESPIVPENLSLREFANNYVIGSTHTWRRFLVTDDAGQLVGAIDLDDMKTIPTGSWPQVQVKELLKPIEFSTTVKPELSLLEVVNLLEQLKVQELPVTGENGVLVGLVEKAEIARLLQRRAQANPA
ncbi:MAG: site-2 protease family protein [Microcoleus sp. PH2017_10_PVI_O_A]|uniref:site-2 protease family protein n=1 Tax=unclassified Microcoleus TaxID=2642155 RepID=UPI001DC326B8|nr:MULTISPECIES: site-2 protease family protein [unclassified Microcoleus]TAE80829.1 MAG: CBS domain-containing protein [Oscillatoriales cyanobacterium]MCC3407779.1 site-2 protease family protein [Microcoleus sp. PH2017_10_PVI_O_A]MCC3461479.1 site-2 protease family protein [Microcoleus sp. PH2017_11_PCY_U_A]MCC3479953.1 site-2 protease family protein [Microcoleus sp. PH2017_12_PCY_D_A]MCC3528609.1 site-2 protease family protein [Microcoleus sp. PH2017_21_RUC_O_A]